MTQPTTDAAIKRFGENEERVDIFVNQNGSYTTNEPAPRQVKTLPSFMSEMISRYFAIHVRGAWATATAYQTQDIVSQGGFVYVCLADHTSGTFATDQTAGKWGVYDARFQTAFEDYNATGNGSTNDTANINNALQSNIGRSIIGRTADYLVDSGYLNKGTRIEGPSRIVKAITGGLQQLNTYTNNCSFAIGHEYLFRLYYDLNGGASYIRSFVYGDSTTTDGYTSANFFLSTFLPKVFKRKGFKTKLLVTNRGVGGTSVYDANVIPDLGADGARLIFLKYGINDGATSGGNINTFATNLRAKLAEIRSTAYGSIDALAIVLVGPNSTSDTPNKRDEVWYEQCRGVYEQAARDYRCFYFDTYAFLQDSRWSAGLSMDNPYSDGRAIHPTSTMQPMIWGRLFDEMLSFGETSEYKTNHFTNVGSTFELPLASALPSTYDYGITLQRGTAANGWPADGLVMTVVQADRAMLQYCNIYADGLTRVHVRCSNPQADTWGRWSGVGEAITLANGWANQSPGGWKPAKAAIDPDNFVHFEGLLAAGTATATTIIGYVPFGMGPGANIIVQALGIGGSGSSVQFPVPLFIQGNGSISLWNALPAGVSYLSLDGITFKIA